MVPMLHRYTSRISVRKQRVIVTCVAVIASLGLILAACQVAAIPPELTGLATTTPGASASEAVTEAPTEAVAPDVDRVGFPEGYQESFELFYEFDRPDNNTARVIYANELAASVTSEDFEAVPVESGKPFPYGSILVMDVYRTQRDEAGNVVLDENGRFVRDELSGIFVMRKEPGFGAKYGHQRNGEWEYMAYRPDGSVLTPPERTIACAACHVEASQGRDWVFGAHRFFASSEGTVPTGPGENEVILEDYTFKSNVITVPVGTEVTWTSQDVVFHTVTAGDWAFNSGMLRPNASFRHTFEVPGEYEYICAIHPSMHGAVVVTEDQ
jgi:plastocyanin